MRKPVLLIFINAMILIVVFVLLAQSLVIVPRIAQADKVSGTVQVQRGGEGQFRQIKSGQSVLVGDVLRTGANGGAEFTWADKTRWILRPKTQLTIKKATINSVKGAENSEFALDSGRVFVRIVKPMKLGSSFQVKTPQAVASVQGTVFSVEVTPRGATCVETYAGSVQLSSGNASAAIGPGTAGTTSTASQSAAGQNAIVKSEVSGGDFRSQPELVRPALSARAIPLKGNAALIHGETETGDRLEIGGKRALVLGNGSFNFRVTLKPGHNEWSIVTTDKHGATSNQCRALDYSAATGEISPGACR